MASTARFDELKKKFDENPRRYFAPLANEFRKSGDAEQAVMICEEFLPQQPGHMSGHIVYGQALFDLGRLDDARTVFETALTLDPENLIALRHLGDIARAHGDPASARHWYQRVLDADPRNEEVQALITDLDAGASSAPVQPAAASAPSATSLAFEQTSSIELAPAFETAASTAAPAPPPLPSRPPAADDSLLELDVVDEHALGAPAPPAPGNSALPIDTPPPAPPSSATTGASAATMDGLAEGFEPMEFAAPPRSGGSAALPDQVESGEFSAPSAPVAPLPGLEETAVGAFEARPSTPLPPLPELEPLAGLREDSSTDANASNELPVDIPPEVIAAEAELIDAREATSEATDEPRAAAAGTAPAPAPPPRVTPSQPFVTETMAELYVKQGFREQALDVYKLLLAATPDSQRLRDRVAELQAPAASDGGPSVRDFLSRLAARRPGERGAALEPPASDDFASGSRQPSPPPAAGEGSIDALFGQRAATADDTSAASALAQAFGGTNEEPPPISGRPARAAAGELSLDSVFRDGGARPPRSAQSFSFDQFFSESAASERPAEPGASPTPSQGTTTQGAAADQSSDDIEQFNSWLQGLKQR